MSRAFVREADGSDAFENLPDKRISEHRNLVTETGLRLIEAEVRRIELSLAEAQASNDREAIARAARDLRYWSQRRSSAELVATPAAPDKVAFGTRVTLRRGDGRLQSFRIVGEDEADPVQGTLSYVSPLAQSLLGHGAGDEVRVANDSAEIVAITGAMNDEG